MEIILAIVGNTLGGIFTHFIINKMPKVFQEFYNKLLYYSITLNIVIILILLIVFFVIMFRHIKKYTALIVIFIVSFVVALEGFGIYRMYKIKDKSLVLIAKFEDSSKQLGIDIDGRIYEQLLSDKESNTNLSSLIIERIPTVIKNEEEAKKEGVNGIRRNAKIIIVVWGKNDDIGGTTYFYVVKAPKKELITKIPIEKEMSTIEEIRNLNFSYYKEILPDTIKFFSYFTFGLSSYSENNYTKALSYFNESLNRLPKDGKIDKCLGDVHFYMGNCYYFNNDLPQAEKGYREAISINPDDIEARNNLGNVLYDLKRYGEAEKEWKEAISINQNLVETHVNLGVLYEHFKRYDEAEKEFREAIRISQNFADAHNNLGTLLEDLKRYDEAEKEYREAIRINPDDIDVHINLGLLLAHYLKHYDEAEKEYREAIRINPNFAEAHYNLGTLLLQKELLVEKNSYCLDEAEKEFREAIRINPNFAEAHNNLGALLILAERKEEAKQEILKARKLFEEQEKVDDVKRCDEILEGL